MALIERKNLIHLINATPSETNATWFLLGDDLEEYNIEMNAEVETKKNILGMSSIKASSYAPQSSVEPYYADEGTSLHTYLQDLIDNRKMLDDLKTEALEVHLWEDGTSSGSYVAYKDEVIVEITSYGGDTTGYQIKFNLHYTGNRVKGEYNPTTKTFS